MSILWGFCSYKFCPNFFKNAVSEKSFSYNCHSTCQNPTSAKDILQNENTIAGQQRPKNTTTSDVLKSLPFFWPNQWSMMMGLLTATLIWHGWQRWQLLCTWRTKQISMTSFMVFIRFFYWYHFDNWVLLKQINPSNRRRWHWQGRLCTAASVAFSNLSLFNRGTHGKLNVVVKRSLYLTLLLNWVSLSICIDLSFSKEKKYKQNTSVIENFCPFWPNQWAVMMKLLLSQNKVSSSKQWYLDTLESLCQGEAFSK